jgi:tRNA pseudouridine55 synthase
MNKQALQDIHGVLLLDKPSGWGSTDALNRVKRLLGARKAGHGGTLDPMATGLLPLAFRTKALKPRRHIQRASCSA